MKSTVDRVAQQTYDGIWRWLVQWFKVPHEPPSLPVRPGEHLEQFKPADAFLRYLKLFFWFGLCGFDLVALLGWLGSFLIHPMVGITLFPVFIVVAVLPDIVVYVAIHLRYDTTWYVLSDRSVRIRQGIWTINETTITFENIQDVKIDQGPIQRLYGISDIIIQTAGGGAVAPGPHGAAAASTHIGRIEGIADAARIRDLIMNRVRQSRTSGLGDEHHPVIQSAQHPSTRAWTPAHLQALRDIRESLAELRVAGV